jgi:hypothetical protein
VDRTVGDYFISDTDDLLGVASDAALGPIVVPAIAPVPAPAPAPTAEPPAEPAADEDLAAPVAVEAQLDAVAPPSIATAESALLAAPVESAARASRGRQLASALDELINDDSSIHAAALVSLDGLTMASALPAGMEPDRVGAMSAAILGLGERAAAELGRGQLSQVIVEGAGGYVLLLAAGSYAVLTAIADRDAKLGLVLYEMRFTARRVADVLG